MTEGHIEYLIERAVESTEGEIAPDALAALPAIFRQLIGEMAAWRRGEGDVGDLPLPLRICQCTGCIVGVAGDRLREAGFGDEYGFS